MIRFLLLVLMATGNVSAQGEAPPATPVPAAAPKFEPPSPSKVPKVDAPDSSSEPAKEIPAEEKIVKEAKEEIQKAKEVVGESKGWTSKVDEFRKKYYLPKVGAFVSGAVPHPINYGLEFVWNRHFGLAFNTGRFTLADTFGEEDDEVAVDLQLVHQELKIFWMPWKKSFFMGLAYGTQKIFLEAEEEIIFKIKDLDVGVATIGQIEVETQYLTPHIGWSWWTDWGVTFGFDFGAQVPVGNSSSLDFGFRDVTNGQLAALKNREEYKEVEEDVNDTADLVGKTVLPYINLFKVGYIF